MVLESKTLDKLIVFTIEQVICLVIILKSTCSVEWPVRGPNYLLNKVSKVSKKYVSFY